MDSEERIMFEENRSLTARELTELYEDAGWMIYAKDPAKLENAVKRSLCVITASVDGKIAGLIRCVGDGLTIIYIQDLLVMKNFRRRNIGSGLMKIVLEKYKDVRQIVLLTDNKKELSRFYEAAGLKRSDELDLICYLRIA